MFKIKTYRDYLVGPRLHRILSDSKVAIPYCPNIFESLGNKGVFITKSSFVIAKLCWDIVKWPSPILILFLLYKSPMFEVNQYASKVPFNRMLFFLMAYVNVTTLLRATGRLMNPEYRKFSNCLQNKNYRNYDFDFWAWPINFEAKINENCNLQIKSYLQYIAPIALKIIYPGSTSLVNLMMAEALADGRMTLINKFNASRYKIRTGDQNDLDIIFIDRRTLNYSEKGQTLVIVCEGNCGFYECGSMMTAVDAKYSVLGWNHPGFGGSTGQPFPSQEKNAIDAVMQFATDGLDFPIENIILYGWSIGGFTSSWAAGENNGIKGLILDATFDNILPLAISRVPNFMETLAVKIIKNCVNLDVLENVKRYNGPVTFIRRSNDEMICTVDGDPSTNRCNHLVGGFLKYRYPNIIDNKREAILMDFLTAPTIKRAQLRDMNHIDNNKFSVLLNNLQGKNPIYPIQEGDHLNDADKTAMTIFLVDKHLTEYQSTHCIPLPVNLFREPTI